MSAPFATIHTPPDFPWHQSRIAQYLSCPRRFKLEYVDHIPLDCRLSGYASCIGTALHDSLKDMVEALMGGATLAELDLDRKVVVGNLEHYMMTAVAKAQDRGYTTDEETIDAAFDKLAAEKMDLLMLLRDDPRLGDIEWLGAEVEFDFADSAGRHYKGTIDAIGRARRYVPDFAADGRDRVSLREGELLVVDWKTGALTKLGHVERSRNVQLAFYRWAMAYGIGYGREALSARTFLGNLADLAPYKRPRDAEGNAITERIKELNPEWLKATGLEIKEALKSKKRPKDAAGAPIKKWSGRPNPAYAEATSKPRGAFFHECRINQRDAMDTVRWAIQGAELGLFPATGALVGGCMFCPFRRTCASGEIDTQGEEKT